VAVIGPKPLFWNSAAGQSLADSKHPFQIARSKREVGLKFYAVAEIVLTDAGWTADYVAETTKLVEAHGGRYLARTTNFEQLEGEREVPQIYLLIEWPSKGAAESFYADESYKPHREARRAGSKGDFFLVAGEDMAGIAKI
jgi:uncharacterized protein (DUF1330 family)